jgi:electron transfer flavoprotein beta subunit
MNLVVLMRMVPDVVEELEIASDQKSLDPEALRLIVSESDDHALEEALLLKERCGGGVTVVAPEAPEVADLLYTAAAKGADRVIQLRGIEPGLGVAAMAEACAAALSAIPGLLPADLVLTGTQSIEDLDGLVAPLVARRLGWPYLGVVTGVSDVSNGTVTVIKEFQAGYRGEFQVSLPAVLGVQAAEKPPRYVPVAKVRAAMKATRIEEFEAPQPVPEPLQDVAIVALAKPEAAGHAEMLEGSVEDVAGKLCELLAERGLL